MNKHKRSTLMGYSKEDLVAHCIALEHNNELLRERFEIQYANCMRLLKDMDLLNKGFKEARK